MLVCEIIFISLKFDYTWNVTSCLLDEERDEDLKTSTEGIIPIAKSLDKDSCSIDTNHPCENGGICIHNDDGTTSCQCPKEYHGVACEISTFAWYNIFG